jgi:proteasome accessory factor C
VSNPVPRLRRLLAIIPLLQRRQGISLQELQDTLGVSKRELKGDLDAIMLCGVPPYLPNDYISVFIDGDHVTVEYADHFARPARLSLREALALRLAIERLPLPEDGPLADAAIELLDVLDRVLRKSGQGSLRTLEGRIETARDQGLGERLALIDEAVAERRPLEFAYFNASKGKVKLRRVSAWGRGDHRGNQYFVALDEQADPPGQRHFRVDRMTQLQVVRDGAPGAAPPPEFNLDDTLEKIGPRETFPLRLRFKQAIARVAAEDHAEFRVEKAPGGDIVVEMTAGTDPFAASYALQYGELVEILEPTKARDALVDRLKEFLASPKQRR